MANSNRSAKPDSAADSTLLPDRVPTASVSWHTTLLAAGLIILAGLATYANSFSGSFIYDDATSIPENPTIRRLWPMGQVLSPPNHGETVAGRPVLNLSLALNYAFCSTNPWGYHVTNLVIHILNGLLLLGILRRTFCLPVLSRRLGNAALGLALAIALLWTVHPVQTESVTYIVQRAESLGAMFYLFVLYTVIRGSQSAQALPCYALAVGASLLGVATKEVVATAPVMVLLYDRTFLSGSFQQAVRRRWGLYVGLFASWGLLVGLLSWTRLFGQTKEVDVVDLWPYARSQPGVILHYLRLSVWPHPLCFNYEWPIAAPLSVILPAIVVGLMIAATVRGLRGGRTWGFLGAWFFLILTPTSSILPLQQLAFEHRVYLSLAAVLTAVVLGAYVFGQRWSRQGMFSGGVGMAMGVCLVTAAALLLGWLSFQRNKAYETPISIWQDTVLKAPQNRYAHSNLGLLLTQAKRPAEGAEHLQEALRLKHDFAGAHTNLGVALADLGRIPEAINHYQEAIRLQPNYAPTYSNYGNALLGLGRIAEAIEQYEQALKLDPDNALAHTNLGTALSELGRNAEALEHYEWALRTQPESAEIYHNLALVLAALDRYSEAIEKFRHSLRLNPDLAESHYNLAVALALVGQVREAIDQASQAVRLQPNQAQSVRYLAWLMATHGVSEGGDPKQAVELAERACSMTGRQDLVCLDTLAAAYASAGRFDEAIATAKAAWQMAQAAGQGAQAEDLHIRLQTYRDRKPYRLPPPATK
jgi:tetratricopeptide (TPR) repeat protein